LVANYLVEDSVLEYFIQPLEATELGFGSLVPTITPNLADRPVAVGDNFIAIIVVDEVVGFT